MSRKDKVAYFYQVVVVLAAIPAHRADCIMGLCRPPGVFRLMKDTITTGRGIR
jgi:hypothetical protein